jgi:hypothetical protein
MHSWATLLLPYIEQENVYRLFDVSYNPFTGGPSGTPDPAYRTAQLHVKSRGRAYDDPAQPSLNGVPQYIGAARTKIKTYQCPSTPVGPESRDPVDQFGPIDYMAIALTDIEARTNGPVPQGHRSSDITQRVLGAMTCDGRKVVNIADGSSNTILVIEDAGRSHPQVTSFGALSSSNRFSNMMSPLLPMNPPYAGSGPGRRVFAWVDADACTNGVSGPSNATPTAARIAKVNNHSSPIGGPAGCPWSTNNCGPNDEPFSFHSGIVQAVMADGSVRAIRDSIDPLTLKWVSGAEDGQVIGGLE